MGEMADLYSGEYPDDRDPVEIPPVTCNRCGAKNLEWVDAGGNPTRYRLFERDTCTKSGMPIVGKMHVCQLNISDDFEVVE